LAVSLAIASNDIQVKGPIGRSNPSINESAEFRCMNLFSSNHAADRVQQIFTVTIWLVEFRLQNFHNPGNVRHLYPLATALGSGRPIQLGTTSNAMVVLAAAEWNGIVPCHI
jgi:hypothetical protein